VEVAAQREKAKRPSQIARCFMIAMLLVRKFRGWAKLQGPPLHASLGLFAVER